MIDQLNRMTKNDKIGCSLVLTFVLVSILIVKIGAPALAQWDQARDDVKAQKIVDQTEYVITWKITRAENRVKSSRSARERFIEGLQNNLPRVEKFGTVIEQNELIKLIADEIEEHRQCDISNSDAKLEYAAKIQRILSNKN